MPTIFERLSALAALDAVSGQEQPVVAYLQEALAGVADEVTVDAVGNLYAVRRGARPCDRAGRSASSSCGATRIRGPLGVGIVGCSGGGERLTSSPPT
ncbi:MAG: hypothetical protein P1P87_09960, partial [Trueperaceae bacterium]|nr:hypothetical protein [Trueperaceae bacterium]